MAEIIRGGLDPARSQPYKPAIVRTTLFQGCHFAYKVQGVGEPVVLIQGVGVHGDGWRPQTDALRTLFCCLSFDNRGMASSQPSSVPITVSQMAADTLAIMDAAGIPSAHVVGHSLGGCVAQQIALSKPDRVKSLSLLCTSARGADATRFTLKLAWLGARSRIGTARMRRRAFLRIVVSPQYVAGNHPDRTAADLAPIFGHDLGETPPIVMRQLGALKRFNAQNTLNNLVAIPTLVLSATNDVIFPPQYGRMLAEGIPGARFIVLPHACHGATIEHAHTVNTILTEHIDAAARQRKSEA
jgi:pimeloyl-ACP methyl ester carboxylesterase